jgi:hypothetical protein
VKTLYELCAIYDARVALFASRDERNRDIAAVMEGRFHEAFPNFFRSPSDRPLVSNALRVAAEDYSQMLAKLPTISAPKEKDTKREQRQADKRGRIAVRGYWADWNWPVQALQGALWFLMYGYVPVCIWPYNTPKQLRSPLAEFADPAGYYPGPVEHYGAQPVDGFVTFELPCAHIGLLWPEVRSRLTKVNPWSGMRVPLEDQDKVPVARYHGRDEITMFLPREREMLYQWPMPAKLARPTLLCAARPGVKLEAMEGQFDQLLGVLLGQARMTALLLMYGEEQVMAPIEIDEDVRWQEGPKAIMRRPRGAAPAQKVGLQMPADVWRELDIFEQHLYKGSRRPATRDGQSPVSYATGKGIDALGGATVDTQLSTYQTIWSWLNTETLASGMCVDEAFYPNERKPIGELDETYVPVDDLAGRYWLEATYGILLGVNPSYFTVMVSQLIAAGLISRETAMEQLPNLAELGREKERLRGEQGEQAIMAYVAAAAGAGDRTGLDLAIAMAPNSEIARLVNERLQQAEAEAQAQAAQAQAQAGAIGQPGAPAAGGEPAAAVEDATQAIGQGATDLRALNTLMGPLAQQMGQVA